MELKPSKRLNLDDLKVKSGIPILCDKSLVFSKHVLERMNERRISPVDVFVALQHLNLGTIGNHRLRKKINSVWILIVVNEESYRRTLITMAADPDQS